ncbi:MAG: folate-binding protein YgfZ, partial [Anaerolineae bacterium]|nr:folate-binding protein YgfZ [Anaerolineae bacterium]
MSLQSIHQAHGAHLAPDGIPLHYDDLLAEYNAALHQAVLLDRSHEGRLQVFGSSRFELLNRMSTNKLVDMQPNEGRPTIFTTANARIIDRIIAYNRDDHLLLITEPGRGEAVQNLLQRNIFFGDDAQLVNISAQTHQFALHGIHADAVMDAIAPGSSELQELHSQEISLGDTTFFAGRRKAISGNHWALVVPQRSASQIYETLLETGKPFGLRPAGSLTYNTLRIRAGRPARPELSNEFIPLEIGLWDEVSFNKGCYTGQEIIARMESRNKLAKMLVCLTLQKPVQAPAEVFQAEQPIGTITSSAEAP